MPANELGPPDRDHFFRQAISRLTESGLPFMVGGAYALERYTGVARRTKDIDLFVAPDDCRRVLAVLSAGGYGTEMTDPTWIAKVFRDGYYLDIIFNSGNAICPVDAGWLEHAPSDIVLGLPVKLCPLVELIWQKLYIMERERFDGADVMHILRVHGRDLEWNRLIERMGAHWQVLLAHLTLFDFIYPGERDAIPQWVRGELFRRVVTDPAPGPEVRRLCRGTLLSRYQYLIDLDVWRLEDARVHQQTTGAA